LFLFFLCVWVKGYFLLAAAVALIMTNFSAEAVIVAALHVVLLHIMVGFHDLYYIAVVAVAIIIERDNGDVTEVEGWKNGNTHDRDDDNDDVKDHYPVPTPEPTPGQGN
jgi:hypothetical protein